MNKRNILYRAKRIDNGKWEYGDLIHEPYGTVIQYYEEAVADKGNCAKTSKKNNVRETVDAETICEYTGLTDKNNRKIFEGDIIFVAEKRESYVYSNGCLISSSRWMSKFPFKVEFTPSDLMNVQRFCNSDDIECEIIGNIFENAEILEGDGFK